MLVKAVLAAVLAPVAVTAQLHQLAVNAGLEYFGIAVGESAVQQDSAYRNIVNDKREFGQLVPENGQKWDSTEPNQGQFNYRNADIVPNVAKQNGQLLRCHALVWHSQLPGWVNSGSWNRQTLQSVMEVHINNVMGHFKGACYHWDVINEAINDDGTWRPSPFYNTFGTDFFALSFRLAKAADPNTKLYYNDYNLEYNQAKTDKAVELVRIVQAAGAPIDGVGFQGHLIVGSTPSRSALSTTLRRFTSLGVEVAYTEIDIRHPSVPSSASARVTQANDYANVVGSCLDVAGCVGITIWGFTDKYSWVPGTFPGTGEALIYDNNFNKKPAWTSISSLLAASAKPTGGQPITTLTTSTRSAIITPPPTTTTTTTPAAPTTTPGSGPEQTRWGQCGGNGWQGPTRCQSPYTCQVLNPWYSQCL
ncbi:Glycoside hydrolase superfamily [Rhypophila sp. PSN 637]